VQRQLDNGTDVEKLDIDLKLSTIKPVHAKLMINASKKSNREKTLINMVGNVLGCFLKSKSTYSY
jgi:hypothetical protein